MKRPGGARDADPGLHSIGGIPMSTTTHASALDDLDVYDRLREHARIAVEDADDRLAAGDRVMAAVRLVEASELYRLAAHALDPSVSPTV